MKWQSILRRWLLTLTVGLVSAATSAGPGPQLPAKPAAADPVFASSVEEPGADCGASAARDCEECRRARLARLWETVALNPESAIALARLGNGYFEAGETKLALQSFQLALDQLSADPELNGVARARFRQSVEKRIRFLRDPGVSFAWTGETVTVRNEQDKRPRLSRFEER